MNPDENDLFKHAMEDVTPLKECATVHWLKTPQIKTPRQQPPDAENNFLIEGFIDAIPLAQPLEYKAEGIQQGVLDKLRQGKYPLDASLNLLRQPVGQCRQSLFSFMSQARKNNLRNLLIIHGKGRDDRSHANIVRSYLFRWLQQFDDVQTFCIAQPYHGGSGALYVGLRKSEQARSDNRERHAKHSR
ncbi:DNA endonuclease SmrA [Erwiniaceae bacterium BAC15a-03b]|uniref:DNA endonuclease SmrA n=1 Tax=Winslowiella arboricola TaxID=2978220 RepID=A0A9J6PQ45_9GAMM|nr:DNA endonuclease SmrA [Winslowiella arboricola]MCU5775596.1 DNA endonuclease SmrA [Winslowiella arboricola]MCU5779554.1 DNA endonuclease SmrA [Winslowiella arboricola]